MTAHENPYAIYRQNKRTTSGNLVWHWTVRVVRNRQVIIRRFGFSVYGGEEAALVMAQAYRDAVLLLLPPQTSRERNAILQDRNTSGIAGVRRYTKAGAAYWQATYTTTEKLHCKSFSVNLHGEEQAKAQAIAMREEYVQRYPNRFITIAPNATEVAAAQFGELLEAPLNGADLPASNAFDKAQTEHCIRLLDAWFDELRPHYVNIGVWQVAYERAHRLEVRATNEGWPADNKKTTVALTNLNWEAALRKAWAFLEKTLIAQHGPTCWDEFSTRYYGVFFATTEAQHLQIRYRYTPLDDTQRRQSPSELRKRLPNFAMPPLPPFDPEVSLQSKTTLIVSDELNNEAHSEVDTDKILHPCSISSPSPTVA